jgi:hypothetical protein
MILHENKGFERPWRVSSPRPEILQSLSCRHFQVSSDNGGDSTSPAAFFTLLSQQVIDQFALVQLHETVAT